MRTYLLFIYVVVVVVVVVAVVVVVVVVVVFSRPFLEHWHVVRGDPSENGGDSNETFRT
jgi:hypothetical protein